MIKGQFILKGFRQATDQRIFEFEHVAADQPRALFTVKADLAMARTHRVPIQELPLLCRVLLEQFHEGGDQRAYEFGEADMRRYADGVTARAEAAKPRKPPRRPQPENSGGGWRGPAWPNASRSADRE